MTMFNESVLLAFAIPSFEKALPFGVEACYE